MNSKGFHRTIGLHFREGFTLLELLVCLGIVGVILSLLLTGVMAARESARKLQCQNNIRQSTLGLLQVIDRKKHIPKFITFIPSDLPNDDPVPVNPLILVARELPIPFQAYHQIVHFDEQAKMGEFYPPSIFNCPSTGDRHLAIRFNNGVDPVSSRQTENTSLFLRTKTLALAEITDGLSNTAALAERPAPINEQTTIMRATALDDVSESFSEMIDNCRYAFENQQVYTTLHHWWGGNVYSSFYDHSRPPNPSNVDCVNSDRSSSPSGLVQRALISARSFHSGGVNVALFDGSVHFVSDQIDLLTWRALGTHNAGDDIGSW